MRGHKDENYSNVIQLCRLRGEDDPRLMAWLKKKTDKYTSAEMQNNMLQIMGLTILREIATCLQNSDFFCIMADETSDLSNHEQLVICIRWEDDKLEAREDFIGLQKLERADASSITALVKDWLIRMNLSIHKARGQCYDGCSTMSGAKTGVATQMKKSETFVESGLRRLYQTSKNYERGIRYQI